MVPDDKMLAYSLLPTNNNYTQSILKVQTQLKQQIECLRILVRLLIRLLNRLLITDAELLIFTQLFTLVKIGRHYSAKNNVININLADAYPMKKSLLKPSSRIPVGGILKYCRDIDAIFSH
jgi:hypothetical protein